MGFSLGKALTGALGGFVSSGFNPLGALAGGAAGGFAGGSDEDPAKAKPPVPQSGGFLQNNAGALIGAAGGLANGLLSQQNEGNNRAEQQREYDLTHGLSAEQLAFQKQQYADTQSKQHANSAALGPILQRLLGQWGGGQMAAPQMPPAPMMGRMGGAPQPVMQQPAVPAPQMPQQSPQDDPRAAIMRRLGVGGPGMMRPHLMAPGGMR